MGLSSQKSIWSKSPGPAKIQHFKKLAGQFLLRAAIYLLLTGFVFVFLYPFIFMMINSFKYEIDLRSMNREWVLTSFNFRNYADAVRLLDYPRTLVNSALLVGLATIGHIFTCAFAAYGLSRFSFPGNRLIFSLVILSILVPPQILMIPLTIQYNNLGWMNSFLPILVPSFLGFGLKGGLFIFLYMQFFRSLPKAYEESAKIEGCSPMRIFISIILPISRTTMLVVGSLSAIWHWNDYFEPNTYLSGNHQILTQKLADIQIEIKMLYDYIAVSGQTLSPVQLACCTIVILPILLYFFTVQRKFMAGIEYSGMAN